MRQRGSNKKGFTAKPCQIDIAVACRLGVFVLFSFHVLGPKINRNKTSGVLSLISIRMGINRFQFYTVFPPPNEKFWLCFCRVLSVC